MSVCVSPSTLLQVETSALRSAVRIASTNLYMYVYTCMYMYMHMHICVYTYRSEVCGTHCVDSPIYVCIYMYVYVYTDAYMCIYIYYTCIYDMRRLTSTHQFPPDQTPPAPPPHNPPPPTPSPEQIPYQELTFFLPPPAGERSWHTKKKSQKSVSSYVYNIYIQIYIKSQQSKFLHQVTTESNFQNLVPGVLVH